MHTILGIFCRMKERARIYKASRQNNHGKEKYGQLQKGLTPFLDPLILGRQSARGETNKPLCCFTVLVHLCAINPSLFSGKRCQTFLRPWYSIKSYTENLNMLHLLYPSKHFLPLTKEELGTEYFILTKPSVTLYNCMPSRYKINSSAWRHAVKYIFLEVHAIE